MFKAHGAGWGCRLGPMKTQRMHARRQRPHLRPAVDDVDLMQRDHVHHLLALLKLSLWALHKLGGRACRGRVGGSSVWAGRMRGLSHVLLAQHDACAACAVSMLAWLRCGWRMRRLACAALCGSAFLNSASPSDVRNLLQACSQHACRRSARQVDSQQALNAKQSRCCSQAVGCCGRYKARSAPLTHGIVVS
jgi:hypothetical protein